MAEIRDTVSDTDKICRNDFICLCSVVKKVKQPARVLVVCAVSSFILFK